MIHKTAIIDPKAKISSNVKIGPYSVIGPHVEIDEGVLIQSHVNIEGHTIIGKNNKIYPMASIGSDPQDLKYKGEKTKLIIGDNNTIREHATINTGTVQGGNVTKVGNNNLIMIGAHIAHDCIIGNNIVMANNSAIAGHAVIDDFVIIGAKCGIQQFVRIGTMAMIGGMTGVSRDVIPYCVSTGNRNFLNGINVIGLRRSKVKNKDIIGLTEAYKEIFKSTNLNENLGKLNGKYKDNSLVNDVLQFINKDKKRPICTPYSEKE
jgi:UDP-N-acetylglucosamine acyltransferase